MIRTALFFALVLFFVLSCGKKQEKANVPQGTQSAPAGAPEAPHQFTASDYQTTASGLKYVIWKKGNGPKLKKGDRVFVHYVGWLLDGTKFDSSYDRGQPISFVLGSGQVIPGWDEGIALLHVGDKAQLIIPPQLAYGEQGIGPIPPNATLVFEVEVVRTGS